MDPAYREILLRAITDLEPDHRPKVDKSKCSRCEAPHPPFRCLHCFHAPFMCGRCMVKEHISNPLHRIEQWSGNECEGGLAGASLKSLGLCL
ncbi:hypothetical protein B0H10DRAFT_2226890 [Mycena sp. CBHHK59/15]|nr:hypothetical protein B0H10DRAFT_2226890 [Mycena sp. CBHHK59/15]